MYLWCMMKDLSVDVFNFQFWEKCSWCSWWYTVHHAARDEDDDVRLLATLSVHRPRFSISEGVRIGLGFDWSMQIPCVRFYWLMLAERAIGCHVFNETLSFIFSALQHLKLSRVRSLRAILIQMPCYYFSFSLHVFICYVSCIFLFVHHL